VARPDGAHVDDLAVEQLDTIVFIENPFASEPEVILGREPEWPRAAHDHSVDQLGPARRDHPDLGHPPVLLGGEPVRLHELNSHGVLLDVQITAVRGSTPHPVRRGLGRR
jgi:hypothetical protein